MAEAPTGDDDDDYLSVGYSVSSSVSGASLVGTGQGAPSYCEITADLCRATTTGTSNGVRYLCAKAGTCGSKGHAASRNSVLRGLIGYYKVAGFKKATQQATRVFADSRMNQEEYLTVLSESRVDNRRAAEALLSRTPASEVSEIAAPDPATRNLLLSPGATTRRATRASLKKAPRSILTPQQDAIAESYSLLGDSVGGDDEDDDYDDDTVDTGFGSQPRTPGTHGGSYLRDLEAEQVRLAARSAEVARAMKDAMVNLGPAAAKTTPVIENSRHSTRLPHLQEPPQDAQAAPPTRGRSPVGFPPVSPGLATTKHPPVSVPEPAPTGGTDPEIMRFLVNQVQNLQTKLDTLSTGVPSPRTSSPKTGQSEIPPEPKSPTSPREVSTKVYAVAQGRDASSRGVYETWAGASPHVHGIRSAVFKKCATMALGWRFIQDFVDNQEPPTGTLGLGLTGGAVDPLDAAARRVNFGVSPTSGGPTPATTGVGFGVDISSGTGTHAFGVRTNLGTEMLTKLAPESMTVSQRVRLGEQILDSVAQPGMSFSVESDATMVEAFTDAIEGLTIAADKRTAGSTLGGHKDGHWRKTDHVSLKKVVDVETLQDHMVLLQSAQKADLELTKTAIEEVYTRCGYSPERAEQLALTGGVYRVSVDTYAFYIGLHIHLLSLALTSGFPAAQLEMDYHIKKLVILRKRLPSRLQVMMANYTYLRDLMRTGWSCLSIELLHRKALQESFALLVPPLPGPVAPVAVATVNAPCGWCGSGLHGYNQPVNSCPWKPKSRTQAKAAAREAMRNLAQGIAYAPPPAEGG